MITSGGWKQEGLGFTAQNEAFSAQQGSSCHVRERIHHPLTGGGFSLPESQTVVLSAQVSCLSRSSVTVELEHPWVHTFPAAELSLSPTAPGNTARSRHSLQDTILDATTRI